MRLVVVGLLVGLAGMAHAEGSIWDGPYVGAAIGQGSGVQEYCPCPGGTVYTLEGGMSGLIAGYNLSSGALVYGAELGASFGSIYEIGFPGYEFTNMIDVKGRVGYDLGSALVYGTLGYSSADWSEKGAHSTASGFLYGVGVDVRIGERYLLGVELLSREMSNSVEDFNATVETVTVRAAMGF